MRPTTHHPSENGSALIIALIILAAITLLSLGSMKNSVMQERMASSERDLLNTFFSAESMVFSLNAKLNSTTTSAALTRMDPNRAMTNYAALCGRSILGINLNDSTLPWVTADGASGTEGASSSSTGFDAARTHKYLLVSPPQSCVAREQITSARMGAVRHVDFSWLMGKGGSEGESVVFSMHSIWK